MDISVKFTKEELKELISAVNTGQIHSPNDETFNKRGIILAMLRTIDQLTAPDNRIYVIKLGEILSLT